MTTTLAYVLYGMLILVYGLLAVFIVYHFYKFTLSKARAMVLISLFSTVTVVLFVINLSLFVGIDFEELLPSYDPQQKNDNIFR